MSAETIREAAALMRARAEKATPGHYGYVSKVTGPVSFVTRITSEGNVIAEKRDSGQGILDLHHLSYWSPDVALAVADLLDGLARDEPWDFRHDEAVAVALTYLGRES